MSLRKDLSGFLKLPESFFHIPAPAEGDPDVGVLGIPYDLTSSYLPGCRFGPDAIRRATTGERSHSTPLAIGTPASPEQRFLSELLTLEDVGDLEVTTRLPEAAMYDISDAAQKLGRHRSFLLFLGGDHFVTYPVLKGLKRGRQGKYGLVWLDAHADFYPDYGGYQLSHATSLRRIVEAGLVRVEDVLAYDVRSALGEQRMELAGTNRVQHYTAESFQKAAQRIADRTEVLYVSLDLDILRPEVVPGVGHPESGGLDMAELVGLLRTVFSTGKVRYADIVELNPLVDTTGVAAIAARDIVKELLTGFAMQKGLKQD